MRPSESANVGYLCRRIQHQHCKLSAQSAVFIVLPDLTISRISARCRPHDNSINNHVCEFLVAYLTSEFCSAVMFLIVLQLATAQVSM
jgi:hypothetical protein